MKRQCKRMVLMLQFLTSIPVPVELDANEEDFGKGLVYAPLVGIVLGFILAGCGWAVRSLFGASFLQEAAQGGGMLLPAVMTVIIYIVMTGGLHLDGLGDTFDGLFSNRSRERMLEIMRDSRVGTNGVLAIASVLLLDTAAFAGVPDSTYLPALVLMPAAGRIGSLVGSGVSTYARKGQGLGKAFIDYCGGREMFLGLLLICPFFYIFLGWKGIGLMLVAILSTLLFTWAFSRRIGGMTGDTLGAVCELNQAVYLCAFLLL